MTATVLDEPAGQRAAGSVAPIRVGDGVVSAAQDLVLYARVLGAQTLPPPATFRGNAYFTVDLGQDGTSYNSARLNETQRVSRIITIFWIA